MGSKGIRYSGVSKVEGVNYARSIRDMILGVKRLIGTRSPIKLERAALVNFRAVIKISLINVHKADYPLICQSLGLPCSQSLSEIMQSVHKKWDPSRGKLSIEKDFTGLEVIYKNSEFNFIEKDYTSIRSLIRQLHFDVIYCLVAMKDEETAKIDVKQKRLVFSLAFLTILQPFAIWDLEWGRICILIENLLKL